MSNFSSLETTDVGPRDIPGDPHGEVVVDRKSPGRGEMGQCPAISHGRQLRPSKNRRASMLEDPGGPTGDSRFWLRDPRRLLAYQCRTSIVKTRSSNTWRIKHIQGTQGSA